MSVRQVNICTGGECNGECYACRLKAVNKQCEELKASLRTLREYLTEAHYPDRTARGDNGQNHGGDGPSGCSYCTAIRSSGRLLR